MKPSRHMPRREPQSKPTWLARIFLCVSCGALLYGVVAIMLLSIWTALAIGLFVITVASSSALSSRKFRQLRDSRRKDNICAFARSVPIRELDTWVIRATYEELAIWVGDEMGPFPVHAADRLVEDLEIDGEDLCDVVIAISNRCERTLDEIDKNPLLPKMKTVEDLIRVVMWQKCGERVEP